jgi:hypothetical protein
MKSVAEQQEVPNEEAAVETVRAQENRSWDTGTHERERPRTMLHNGPRRDGRSGRHDGKARYAIMEMWGPPTLIRAPANHGIGDVQC